MKDLQSEWKNASPIPTEQQEQEWLFRWIELERVAHPELGLMYHIPNEGKRSNVTGARMRRAGLKKGVPDLCLPVPRDGCHGLYIELKRTKGGAVSKEQLHWVEELSRQGYQCSICYGWEHAMNVIKDYLDW